MIEVESLAKHYPGGPGRGGFGGWLRRRRSASVGVRDVSFRAEDGRITGLLGPNGAGKTTTMRMMAGLIQPDAGRVRIDGLDSTRDAGVARGRLGVLGDPRGLYPRLSARENIAYYAALQGLGPEATARRIEELDEALALGPLLDRRTEGFSQGERMKTALARALIHDPPNLLLDEPSNGLDVMATRALRATLRHLASPAGGGKCIVLSSHVMSEVAQLCDEIVIVARGRTVARGSVATLCAAAGEADFEEAFVRLAFGDVQQDGMPGPTRPL